MRELRLTSPFMTGEDVKFVQRMVGVLTDGEYGPATGSHVKAYKYRMGWPSGEVNTGIGPDGQKLMHVLDKGGKLPASYRARRLARIKIGFKPGWGIAKVEYNPADAATIMEGWAGLTESPAGSNVVPKLREEGNKLGVGWEANMGYPWCAYAAFLSGLKAGGQAAKYGLIEEKFNELYTVDILYRAQHAQFGLKIVGRSQAQRGDLVMFNFPGGDPRVDHIGRLRAAPGPSSDSTVEGNTSSGNGGSQSNGGGVFLRQRPHSEITAYIRDN